MDEKFERDWLVALQRLLAPLAPRHLTLLVGSFAGEEVSWITRLPAGTRVLQATADSTPHSGWLVPLPAEGHALLVDGGAGLDACDPALVMARVLCRAAWRMRHPPPQVLVSNESRQALHDLRNGLNSVLMTSAVIGGAALPEGLGEFVSDLEQAGKRSLRALAELSAYIAPR
jgi:hypothetical protein